MARGAPRTLDAIIGRVPTEIERKFLLPGRPDWLDGCRSKPIEQGYLAIGEEDEVRIRRSGDGAVLTVKRGHGEERLEQEVGIGEEQLAALWPLTEGRRIDKRRYYVDGDPRSRPTSIPASSRG